MPADFDVTTGTAASALTDTDKYGVAQAGAWRAGTPLQMATYVRTKIVAADITNAAAGVATFLATPSSANLIAAVTDETGTGALVFANTPTLVTPALGAATATSVVATGNLSISGTGSLGYVTGAGGAVSQGTSRTTTVILNKSTGAITMFSAAGSATWATFTVTNSQVAATDTISLSVKSGTNLYLLSVTAVAAGSFNISFATTGGTATDAPVINFNVIKGVAA